MIIGLLPYGISSAYDSFYCAPVTVTEGQDPPDADALPNAQHSQPVTPPPLVALANSARNTVNPHPLGDLSGALSWPIPLSNDEQARLTAFAQRHTHHLGTQPSVASTPGGILEFLRYQLPLSPQTLNSPAKLLDALLNSPAAKLMGKALREHMQGIATERSDTDYLLAAINLQLDPDLATALDRNTVAGFDLAAQAHIGQPASLVVERLQQHLVAQGRSSLATAAADAHLLLASRAPAFLIKDIPSNITYGSPAWLNLDVAATTVDAQTPGKVPNMTFLQVMQAAELAAQSNPAVTESAQKAALLNWGNAHGVVARKADHLYTPEDMKTLFDTFNARIAQMLGATETLDKALPSRREMALAELSRRFPGKEALFEVKAIKVLQRYFPDNGSPARETVILAGEHSMLDVAMMSLKNKNLVFRSKDSRLPMAELNANKRFRVLDAFEAEFAKGIEDKKKAVGTSIQHLIAQLPLEDRQNFEYGEVRFFQNKAYQLGTDFFDQTPLPTDKALMVSVKRNGKTTAYSIDFDKGSITHALPWQAEVRETRDGSRVSKTETFGDTLLARAAPRSLEAIPDSFASPRTQAIADTFVKHFDLDSQDIKDHAKGSTTEDLRNRKIASIVDVMLDVIPFRSAIVNFQKGNFGDGAFDLALDIFGFLTAGAGTVGKAVKIGNSTLSTATKAYKVSKVIGAAAISTLNPLSGAGDLALGTARLASNGLKRIGARMLQGINELRGATGSYDVLKAASKHHTLAAYGTLPVDGQSVATGAVLKDGKWHAFDVDNMQPYGGALQGFVPTAVAQDGAVKALDSHLLNWLATVVAPNPPTQDLPLVFQRVVSQAKAIDEVSYLRGYTSGRPDDIPGYFPSMNLEQLKELAVDSHRTPEQVGTLFRALEKKRIEISLSNSKIFSDEIRAAGGTLIPMPQGFYLSQADVLSEGECAVLANAMALAIENNKSEILIGNFFTSIADLNNPKSIKFRQDLTRFQGILENRVHGLQTPTQAGHQTIIDDLANAAAPTQLLIRDRGHVVLAGMSMQNNTKQWFYYDPNFGLVKFPTEEAMRKGLDSALSSGRSNVLMQPYGADRARPEYKYAEFNELELMQSTGSITSLHGLFNTAI